MKHDLPILRSPTTVETIKTRVSVADRTSPIIVFAHNGKLYDGFADTIESRRMIRSLDGADYSLVGIFHKDSDLGVLHDANS